MTQQEFNIEIETKATPPKGWIWAFLGGIIKKWLYENADQILSILLTLILGEVNAKKVYRIIDSLKSHRMGIVTDPSSCGGVPKPKGKLSPNGSWECIADEWHWIDDLG